MPMKYVYLIISFFFLSGCADKSHLKTEILTSICIKPMFEYNYQTCNPILFKINGEVFQIPANFKTDLASIPVSLWSIMAPAHSSLIRAAIIHDWLYLKTCYFTRYETDLIFYYVLRSEGISVIRSTIMYYGVRIFGWNYYNKEDCDDINQEINKNQQEIKIIKV